MHLGGIRAELDRPPQMDGRLFDLALRGQGGAQVEMRFGQAGRQFDGPAVLGDGPVARSHADQQFAEIEAWFNLLAVG